MTFIQFCNAHGVLLATLPPPGRWIRVATEDKPRGKNGAVKWLGDVGFVQNWATQTEPVMWRPDADAKPVDREAIQRRINEAERERQDLQERAAKKAGWLMHQCKLETHPYLASKGFEQEQGMVWTRPADEKNPEPLKLLVIPMRVGDRLVGCQVINEAGGKKFLYGQRTHDATFTFDNKGIAILCEGYATGLSIRRCMAALKTRYRVMICFSAGNVARMAKQFERALVVTDNDHQTALAPELGGMGMKVAKESGHPYFVPAKLGQDFNDFEKMFGTFTASQALRLAMNGRPPA